MHTTVYIATSLDGYIARPDGDVDWLGSPSAEAMEDFERFMAGIDCLVMGRATYEKVRAFGAWPYTKPVVVLTHRGIEIPAELGDSIRKMEGTPLEILDRLASEGVGHVYVDGGRTIRSFLAEGLIDRLIVTSVPILLGEGIPLFGPLPGDMNLRHDATRVLAGGLVRSEYRTA